MNLAQARYIAILTPAILLALSACKQPVNEPVELLDKVSVSDRGASEAAPTGKIIEIMMYTVDPDDQSRQHVFKPRLVTAQVGDTIKFIPSEPSHQLSTINTMLPEGVTGWEGAINEEVSFVIPKPGIYGFQCVPHYAAGMVGVVIAEGDGKTSNLDFARTSAHLGLGVPQFAEIFAEAEERGFLD